MLSTCRGLVAGMRKGNGDQPLLAAWAFAALLTIPECPVSPLQQHWTVSSHLA